MIDCEAIIPAVLGQRVWSGSRPTRCRKTLARAIALDIATGPDRCGQASGQHQTDAERRIPTETRTQTGEIRDERN
jgi:hypothetical protein